MSKLSRERGARITAALVLLLDQTLKFLLYSKNLIKEDLVLIKGLLYIVPPAGNSGIAFGLFRNHGNFFIISAFIAIFFIIWMYLKTDTEKTLFRWGLLLILAGAASNLIDRIIHGCVIDYLLLNKFPYSFNLADSSILTGVGLIIINIAKVQTKDRRLMTKDKTKVS